MRLVPFHDIIPIDILPITYDELCTYIMNNLSLFPKLYHGHTMNIYHKNKILPIVYGNVIDIHKMCNPSCITYSNIIIGKVRIQNGKVYMINSDPDMPILECSLKSILETIFEARNI